MKNNLLFDGLQSAEQADMLMADYLLGDSFLDQFGAMGSRKEGMKVLQSLALRQRDGVNTADGLSVPQDQTGCCAGEIIDCPPLRSVEAIAMTALTIALIRPSRLRWA
jgi:hypothetical protein